MTKISISDAARLTGKSRVTIHRHIEKGILSKEKNGTGNSVLDLAELERVYGSLKQPDPPQNVSMIQPAAPNENRILQAENQSLHERIADLEAERVRERGQLAESIHDLRAERDRLLKLVDDQAATVKLLTDQRAKVAEPASIVPPPPAPPAEKPPKGLRGWLHRLTG